MPQPPVIAVEHPKGGVLKTATAIALSEAAAEAGADVLTADTDPQGSAVRWGQLAEATGKPLRTTIVGLATVDLPRRLPLMATAHNMVIIDGSPIREDLIEAGIDAADLVVMPVPPKPGDMDRVPALLKLAANAGKPGTTGARPAAAGRSSDAG
jgi:chromosome partitioning protein